jgi:hypothetical protein
MPGRAELASSRDGLSPVLLVRCCCCPSARPNPTWTTTQSTRCVFRSDHRVVVTQPPQIAPQQPLHPLLLLRRRTPLPRSLPFRTAPFPANARVPPSLSSLPRLARPSPPPLQGPPSGKALQRFVTDAMPSLAVTQLDDPSANAFLRADPSNVGGVWCDVTRCGMWCDVTQCGVCCGSEQHRRRFSDGPCGPSHALPVSALLDPAQGRYTTAPKVILFTKQVTHCASCLYSSSQRVARWPSQAARSAPARPPLEARPENRSGPDPCSHSHAPPLASRRSLVRFVLSCTSVVRRTHVRLPPSLPPAGGGAGRVQGARAQPEGPRQPGLGLGAGDAAGVTSPSRDTCACAGCWWAALGSPSMCV